MLFLLTNKIGDAPGKILDLMNPSTDTIVQDSLLTDAPLLAIHKHLYDTMTYSPLFTFHDLYVILHIARWRDS